MCPIIIFFKVLQEEREGDGGRKDREEREGREGGKDVCVRLSYCSLGFITCSSGY